VLPPSGLRCSSKLGYCCCCAIALADINHAQLVAQKILGTSPRTTFATCIVNPVRFSKVSIVWPRNHRAFPGPDDTPMLRGPVCAMFGPFLPSSHLRLFFSKKRSPAGAPFEWIAEIFAPNSFKYKWQHDETSKIYSVKDVRSI